MKQLPDAEVMLKNKTNMHKELFLKLKKCNFFPPY